MPQAHPEPFVHRHCALAKAERLTCTAACRPVERGAEIGTRQARTRPVRLAPCSKARVSSIAYADGCERKPSPQTATPVGTIGSTEARRRSSSLQAAAGHL